jgi:hypothetical protein
LYNATTGKLFGIFEATSSVERLLEPSAFAPDNTTTTLYPCQVRFRVVAEVPALEENEVSEFVGGNVVQRLEWQHMQRIIDYMIEKGGGTRTVCTKNNIPVPGKEKVRNDKGLFSDCINIAGEMGTDKAFVAAREIEGVNQSNFIRIRREAGKEMGCSVLVRMAGVGSNYGAKNDVEEGPLRLIVESDSLINFNAAFALGIDLIEHVKSQFE